MAGGPAHNGGLTVDARLYRCPECGWFAAPKGFDGSCPKCREKVILAVCTRCGHTWTPRHPIAVKPSRVCPRCKSPYWNRPRMRGEKVME